MDTNGSYILGQVQIFKIELPLFYWLILYF